MFVIRERLYVHPVEFQLLTGTVRVCASYFGNLFNLQWREEYKWTDDEESACFVRRYDTV
jgi:hypothetical protein